MNPSNSMRSPSEDASQREARDKSRMKDSFDSWMESPAVRMLISIVPENKDHPDVLVTILKTAHETGYKSGQAMFAVEMLTSVMEADRKRER